MNEGTVYLIASILVLVAWGGCGSFIVAYAARSNWQSTLVGRTLMHRAGTMFLLLTLALTSRWLELVPIVQQSLALTIYALIGVMEWRLFLVLRYIQQGRVTIANPNYSPIRVWIARRRKGNRDG